MRFLISVVAVILIALLFGAGYYFLWLPRYGSGTSFQSSVVGNPYPDEAEKNFYGTCKSAQEICDCMWNYMEENYSYDEYLQDREEGLVRLNEAALNCADQFEQDN